MNGPMSKKALCGILVAAILLSGCGGARMIREPRHVGPGDPLATAADERMAAALDRVVVRNGPAAWVTNADWDEYRLRIANTSVDAIRILDLTVYDALGTALSTTGSRRELIRGSRAAARRFREEDIEVRAGIGGPALVGAGAASYVAGSALGIAVIGSSASAGAAGVAIGAIAAAPVLVASGAVVGIRNSRIAGEIEGRQARLPLGVEGGQSIAVSAFFPIAPSPRRLEIAYRAAGRDRVLKVELSNALDGLHLRARDAPGGEAADRR